VDRFACQGRLPLERLVEVVHVRLVVPAVVDLHRHRVDRRFEGIRRIGQWRQTVGHGRSPSTGADLWVRSARACGRGRRSRLIYLRPVARQARIGRANHRRNRMRIFAIMTLTVLGSCAVASGGSAGEDKTSDQDRMQGAWDIVSLMEKGKAIPKDETKSLD